MNGSFPTSDHLTDQFFELIETAQVAERHIRRRRVSHLHLDLLKEPLLPDDQYLRREELALQRIDDHRYAIAWDNPDAKYLSIGWDWDNAVAGDALQSFLRADGTELPEKDWKILCLRRQLA